MGYVNLAKSNGQTLKMIHKENLRKQLAAGFFNDVPEPYCILNFVFSNIIFVYQCCCESEVIVWR